MAVAKFNWHGTNPNKTFQKENPPVVAWPEMIIFGATKEENEAAYQALLRHGAVCDFKTKVWNDICAKVYDICDDWNINEKYRTSVAWNPFIHDPDRAAWKAMAKKNWPHMDDYEIDEWIDSMWQRYKPGTFTAWDYNALYSLWLAPLGLSEFTVKKGDVVKAEYVLRLVEVINHWTELRPMDVEFVMNSKWNTKNGSVLLPALPIFPSVLSMCFENIDHVILSPGIPFRIRNVMKLEQEKLEVPLLASMSCSSLMNFMTLNMNCKVWDKEILYTMPEVLSSQHGGKVKLVWSRPFPFGFSDCYQQGQDIRLKLSSDLQDMHPLFFFEYGGSIKPQLWNSYPFRTADSFSHVGTAKIRHTARPIPFSAWTGFNSEIKARVDFEGIHMLDMVPERIGIREQINSDVRAARMLGHEQSLHVSRHKHGMTVVQAATLQAEPEEIVYHSELKEQVNAQNAAIKHKDRISVAGKLQMLNHPPEAMKHTGTIQNAEGGGELTFANEQSMDVEEGSFAVEARGMELVFQDTQVLSHTGFFDTREQIRISEDPPLPVEGEGEVHSASSGVLAKEQVLEQAAETAIKTLSYAEILSGLYQVMESEVTAAKTSSMAALYVRRYFHIASEEEVGTTEYGILDRRLRKLMESSNTTITKEKGDLLLRLIRFASGGGTASTVAKAEIVRTLPRHASAKENTVTTGLSAFLDASYVRGDSLKSEPDISFVAEAEIGKSVTSSYAAAKEYITAKSESELQRHPVRPILGGEIAKTGAEAKLMMARIEKILAFEYEETLVAELEEVNAADVERHLIFS